MSKKASAKKPAKPAAPKAPKPAKSAQPVQNGMTQPREGGKTRAIWDLCDSLKSNLKRVPTRGEVLEAAPKGAKPNMVATQYGYWRRFMGITGRVSAPKPAAPKAAKPAKPAKPAAPAKGAKKPAKPAKPAAPIAPPPPPAPIAPPPPPAG